MSRDLKALVVLVVEDDPDARELVEAFLVDHGAKVTTADDLASAERAWEAEAFDVIVTDLSLPGSDGIELIERARRAPETSGVPVLAVTGYSSDAVRQRAIDAGAARVLVKPFDPYALVEAISACARSR